MARIAGPLLHARHSALTGDAPNGQRFRVNPMRSWALSSSVAALDGRAIGRAFFETGARAAV